MYNIELSDGSNEFMIKIYKDNYIIDYTEIGFLKLSKINDKIKIIKKINYLNLKIDINDKKINYTGEIIIKSTNNDKKLIYQYKDNFIKNKMIFKHPFGEIINE